MPRRTASPRASRACTVPASAPSRSACTNAAAAYKRALSLGAWGVEGKVGPMELNIPAIKGIGDSLIYLVDRYGDRGTIYDVDFEYLPGVEHSPKGVGLTYIDHLTHNVHRGRMDGVGRLLRAALQFPRNPLLRHRGQADRPEEQGDDQPVRQDPHPDQREHRRQVADPGIPLGLSRRGHPAHRAWHRRHLRHGRDAARPRACRSRPCPTPTYEQIDTRLPGHGEDLDAAEPPTAS